MQYIHRIVALVRPSRLLFVAVDGVAPQAKMAQQRQRRYMAGYRDAIRDQVKAEVWRLLNPLPDQQTCPFTYMPAAP